MHEVVLVFKLLVVLYGKRHLRTNQDEQTRPLQPSKQDRNRSKRTIHNACTRQKDYDIHRKHLQEHEERAHQYARDKPAPKMHFRIGNTDVHPCEYRPHNGKLQKAHHPCADSAEEGQGVEGRSHGVNKQAQARGCHHKDGNQHENSDIGY